MTLTSAVARLRARTAVDLDTEVDVTAAVDTTSETTTTELMKAARKVSRETYFLFTFHSTLTLTAATDGSSASAELDLLDTATSGQKSEFPIFHCYGVHINGNWLTKMDWEDFLATTPTYWTDLASATPSYYIPKSPSHIRFWQPPNATAVAASSNYAIGFYLHPQYTFAANSATELKGPEEFHELIIERAYLDLTEGLVTGDSAFKRRAVAEAAYREKVQGYAHTNKGRAHKLTRQTSAGVTRRIFTIGGPY